MLGGGRVVWIDEAFMLEPAHDFKHGMTDMALDDAGGGAVVLAVHSDYDYSDDASVVALAPDHSETWRIPLGLFYHSKVVANGDVMVLQTDAREINGAEVEREGSGQRLVALRVADGSIAWHKLIAGNLAIAADGTVVVAGTFNQTLDVGGTATPLTSAGYGGYVAALDPLTGDGRWALYLGGTEVAITLPVLGVGPAGEVAVAWKRDSAPMSMWLLDASGTVRWTQSTEALITTLVPDGDRVLASSDSSNTFEIDGTFAQYSASGIDWERQVTGDGRQEVRLLTLAQGRLIASIFSDRASRFDPPPTTKIGDVTFSGDGQALCEIAH